MANKAALSLFITPRAQKDIEDIWLFTADNWSLDQADIYTRNIAEKFDVLCSYPEMARERLEFQPPVRIHPHGSHLIIYQVLDNHLEIIRILHSRQRWQGILD